MNSTRPIRVVLADDHAIVRQALACLLDTNVDIDVAGQAVTGAEAVELVREQQPDVLILDVDMPGQDVMTTARSIRVNCPDVAILVLSMSDHPDLVRNLLGVGVRGYMLKTSTQAELVAAIRTVYDDPLRVVLSVSSRTLTAPSTVSPLTTRETDVLRLVAEAKTNQRIARDLNMAESTVKRHLHSSFAKLNAVSRLDAVAKATAAGVLTPALPAYPAYPAYPGNMANPAARQ